MESLGVCPSATEGKTYPRYFGRDLPEDAFWLAELRTPIGTDDNYDHFDQIIGDINDDPDLSDRTREARIKAAFVEQGIEVTFED